MILIHFDSVIIPACSLRMLAVQHKSQLCRLCAQPVPVKGSWTLAIWLPDVPLLPPVPSVETRVSCVNLLPHITQEIVRGGRCLNTPQVFFSVAPHAKQPGTLSSREGCFPATGGGQGHLKKREDFLFWMWCQVLTLLLDHGGKQAAKKRIPGLRSLLVSHVRCVFSGYSQCGRFFFVVVFACGSHKSMATAMLLACGEDSE